MTARSISRSVAVPFARGIVGRVIPTWTPATLFAQGQQGGILFAVDVHPHEQFAEWGIERKTTEEKTI